MSHFQTYGTEECDVLSSNTETLLLSDGHQNIPHVIQGGDKSKVSRESSPPDDHDATTNPCKGSTCGQSLIASDFRCSICGKSFSSLKDLNFHCQIHSEKEPNKCGVKDFSSSKFIIFAHRMRTRTGEKSYKCIACEKFFANSSHLTYHIRTHSGEKPFNCRICGKNFSQKDQLTIHSRTHTGEKPYTCTVCDQRFTVLNNSRVHMRIHTGEKPHTCTDCEKRFSWSSGLTSHMRTHTR